LRPPSLRSQLNQIRLWLRQGRTDAWIAHKLDISVGELESFKRDHRLTGDPPPAPAPEVERVSPPEAADEEEDQAEDTAEDRRKAGEAAGEAADEEEEEEEKAAVEASGEDGEVDETEEARTADEDEQPRRRRRGRRGGRRRAGSRTTYEATFDHGEEGYGLWLDPSVADNPIYSEHWAGHRPVSVTVEADTITIRRSGGGEDS
jgi:hypothetical protein